MGNMGSAQDGISETEAKINAKMEELSEWARTLGGPTSKIEYQQSLICVGQTSLVSDPLDSHFDSIEHCMRRIVYVIKNPPAKFSWILLQRIKKDTAYEFEIVEKIEQWMVKAMGFGNTTRLLTVKYVINPLSDTLFSEHAFDKELWFRQWIHLHSNPLRLEAWREKSNGHRVLEVALKYFEFLLAAILDEPLTYD